MHAHKSMITIKVVICNHQADVSYFVCPVYVVMSDLMICKVKKYNMMLKCP